LLIWGEPKEARCFKGFGYGGNAVLHWRLFCWGLGAFGSRRGWNSFGQFFRGVEFDMPTRRTTSICNITRIFIIDKRLGPMRWPGIKSNNYEMQAWTNSDTQGYEFKAAKDSNMAFKNQLIDERSNSLCLFIILFHFFQPSQNRGCRDLGVLSMENRPLNPSLIVNRSWSWNTAPNHLGSAKISSGKGPVQNGCHRHFPEGEEKIQSLFLQLVIAEWKWGNDRRLLTE